MLEIISITIQSPNLPLGCNRSSSSGGGIAGWRSWRAQSSHVGPLLRDTKRRWAAIAINIFRGAEIPKHFLTTEIGFLLVEALEPGGMIVWNIAEGRNSWPVAWVARALRLIGLAPRIVSVSMDEESYTLIICRRPERPSLSIT